MTISTNNDTTTTAAATGTVRRLWALDAPVITVPTGLLVLGGEGEVDIPLPSFLIEHERGLVLVDTGVKPEAADDPVGAYGEGLAALMPDGYPRELSVPAQLQKLGFEPSDVDIVVMSHLHFDHSGSMPTFQHAQFIGGPGEMQFAWWPDPANSLSGFYVQEDFAFLRERPEQWWEIGPHGHDLFGDGSILLHHLPGHTPGQLAVQVRTPGQTFMLATDVVHLRAGLSGMPMPHDWNASETARSVLRLKALVHAHDAALWIGHDPEDWALYQHAPDCYE